MNRLCVPHTPANMGCPSTRRQERVPVTKKAGPLPSRNAQPARRETQHPSLLVGPPAGRLEQTDGVPVTTVELEPIAGPQLSRCGQPRLVHAAVRVPERDRRVHGQKPSLASRIERCLREFDTQPSLGTSQPSLRPETRSGGSDAYTKRPTVPRLDPPVSTWTSGVCSNDDDGLSIVYERSPIQSVAESMPSATSHDWTVSMTWPTARDSHSEQTRISLLAPSNDTDDQSNSPPRRRMKPCTLLACATGTRISTTVSSPRNEALSPTEELRAAECFSTRCAGGEPSARLLLCPTT